MLIERKQLTTTLATGGGVGGRQSHAVPGVGGEREPSGPFPHWVGDGVGGGWFPAPAWVPPKGQHLPRSRPSRSPVTLSEPQPLSTQFKPLCLSLTLPQVPCIPLSLLHLQSQLKHSCLFQEDFLGLSPHQEGIALLEAPWHSAQVGPRDHCCHW